jgi:hypothetical protein
MSNPNPPVTVQQFQSFFVRDWKYGPGLDSVMDSDIQNALNIASTYFNASLFSDVALGAPGQTNNTTSEQTLAYLYAAAHFLVLNIQAVGGLNGLSSGDGLSSGSSGPIGSKNAGGLSASYQWPQDIINNPMLYQFTRTNYGQQYLQMLAPKLVGVVGIAQEYPTTFGF